MLKYYILILVGMSYLGSAQINTAIKKRAEQSAKPNDDSRDRQRQTKNDAATSKAAEDKSIKSELDRKAQYGGPDFDASVFEARFYSKLQPDFSASTFKPTIAWYSLMNTDCFQLNITNGELRLDNIYIGFLPEKNKQGQTINYNQLETTSGDNTKMNEQRERPPFRVDVMNILTNQRQGSLFFKAEDYIAPFKKLKAASYGNFLPLVVKLDGGKYELRFFIGQEHFYTFPFMVEKKSNSDPYAPVKDLFFPRGAWEDWGQVEFNDDQEFVFNYFTSFQNVSIKNPSNWDEVKQMELLAKLSRDGKQVAVFSVDNENKLRWESFSMSNGKWQSNYFRFYKFPFVGMGYDHPFTKNDLQDGAYVLEIKARERDATAISFVLKYAFTVKNKSIIHTTRADRSKHQDALTFMEEGPSYIFIPKIK